MKSTLLYAGRNRPKTKEARARKGACLFHICDSNLLWSLVCVADQSVLNGFGSLNLAPSLSTLASPPSCNLHAADTPLSNLSDAKCAYESFFCVEPIASRRVKFGSLRVD